MKTLKCPVALSVKLNGITCTHNIGHIEFIRNNTTGDLIADTHFLKDLKDFSFIEGIKKELTPVKLPQYRLLNEGEIIKEGDEIYQPNNDLCWKRVALVMGEPFQNELMHPVRRLIPSQSPAT